MNRMKKIFYIATRWLAFHSNHMKLYYWADLKAYELRKVRILPNTGYRLLFRVSMGLAGCRGCRRLANWTIHMIPYHIRFEIS